MMSYYVMPTYNHNFEPVIRFENKEDANDCFLLDLTFANFEEADHYAYLLEKMGLNDKVTYINIW